MFATIQKYAASAVTCTLLHLGAFGGASAKADFPGAPKPFILEPIPGWTTGRYVAPDRLTIPVGTVVRITKEAASAARVIWTGASEIARSSSASTAECAFTAIGAQVVRAQVVRPTGVTVWEGTIEIDVVDSFRLGEMAVAVAPLGLNESSSNDETMHYYFDDESIAPLRRLDVLPPRQPLRGRAMGNGLSLKPGFLQGRPRYLTSTYRNVYLSVDVAPPAMAGLIEWRLDGQPLGLLGLTMVKSFERAGQHVIEVGPPRGGSIEVVTYSVTITSHRSGADIVPEGVPITFEALTDPPGFEDEITWLSRGQSHF